MVKILKNQVQTPRSDHAQKVLNNKIKESSGHVKHVSSVNLRLERAKSRARFIRGLLDDTSALIEREKRNYGSVQNSTLARYNRLKAESYLHSEDLGYAEKYILIAFGHLKKAYLDATQIEDSTGRAQTMNALQAEHTKSITCFASIKLSFSSRISLQLLKEINVSVSALVITDFVNREYAIWMAILESLNHRERDTNLDFIDDDEIAHFIETEVIENAIVSEDEHRTLAWLCVRIYQAIVKRDRSKAYADIDTAKRLADFRYKSTQLLYELKQAKGAVEDLSESYLFEVIATSDLSSWEKKTAFYEKELQKVIVKLPQKKRYIDSILARMYIRGFNLATKAQDKRKFIIKALGLSREGKQVYRDRLLPYLYNIELIIWLHESKKIQEVLDSVKRKHHDLDPKMDSSDLAYEKMVRLYNSAVGILNDNYLSHSIELMDSLYLLKLKGVLSSDKVTIDLLAKSLSIESSVDIADLEERVDRDSEDVQSIQRLEAWLVNEESKDVEVKLNGDTLTKSIVESICGLANTNGGRIIVGLIEKEYFPDKFPKLDLAEQIIIAKKFVLIGQKSFDTVRQNIASKVKAKMQLVGLEPHEVYSPFILHIGAKDVLVLEVSPVYKQTGKLMRVENKVYGRFDNQTTELSTTDILNKAGLI